MSDFHLDPADDDLRHEELADEILTEWRNDPAKIAEADGWWSGTLDSDHYEAIESALADFGAVGQGYEAERALLSRLHRIAQVCAKLRDDNLRHMAEGEAIARIIREDQVSAEMRDSQRENGNG